MSTWLKARQLNIVALLVGFSMLSYVNRTQMSIAGPGMIRDFPNLSPGNGQRPP